MTESRTFRRARDGHRDSLLDGLPGSGDASAQLWAVLEQMPSGVVVVDRAGQVALINQVGRWLAGTPPGSGRSLADQFQRLQLRDPLSGRLLSIAETAVGQALKGETVEAAEYLFRRPGEDQDVLIQASASPLRDTQGQVTGAVAVFSDVTWERTLLREMAASEARLRSAHESVACGIIVWDRTASAAHANSTALRILGVEPEQLLGVQGGTGLRFLREDGAEIGPEERPFRVAMRTGRPVRQQVVRVERPDGEYRWILIDAVPLSDEGGTTLEVVSSFVDITERKRAEEALYQREQQFKALSESAPDIVAQFDGELRHVYVNRAVELATGVSREHFLGKTHPELGMQPELTALWQGALRRVFETGQEASLDFSFETPSGPRHYHSRLAPELAEDGTVRIVLSVARDVTERRAMEAALAHQALHDGLTGLPNRTLLHDRLDQAILGAQREGRALALLVMDLDRFKEVNDTLGHPAGDVLLQMVGQRLRAALRASDTVARLGGDEFAVLLPQTDERGATQAATKVLRALHEPFSLDGYSVDIEASIGIVLYPEHGQDGQALLRRADMAMYQAKQAHTGYTVFHQELDQHSADRLGLIGELRRAIEHGELMLHYQPRVQLESGRVVGVEALVRWQHPQRGMVPPDQFIPLAEQTGLIEPLTQWVLNAALSQARAWRRRGLRPEVAVNLSMRNLQDPRTPEVVAGLLKRWGAAPDWLAIELTETAVMSDPERTRETIDGLRALGLRIAVDDFGTGYSSLGYLKRLPVQQLKIDRSFVGEMTTDHNDLAIVRAIIDLAHHLGLQVVAEGVEDQQTWDELVALGCDSAQGYFISRPLPAEQLTGWLRQRR